ncbi:MAG: HPr(Ser) kinase/phosphatase [Lentisphaerota bacterium]
MELHVNEFYEAGKDSLSLRVVGGADHMDRVIPEMAINRPGLAMSGFFRYFAFRRIQVIGLAEMAYLDSLGRQERSKRLRNFYSKKIPCIVVTRNRHVLPEMLACSEQYKVPLLRTNMITGAFINTATVLMENLSSPRIRAQGTMVDILGIGVLLEGTPGIGKSETALALIERGHSLVADDITVLRRDSSGSILGSAGEITRYHMEIRGLGIIHVPSLFGVASMRSEMKLDMIIHLHQPSPDEEDDRTGLRTQYREILGTRVPIITVPVAAGRDLAHVVEVAALNQKLKQLGHDAAKELDEKMMSVLSRKRRL